MRSDERGALDELYDVTPAEFVATRKRLAKQHPALAKRRKPTQTAYALNQLARRHPDAVADLVDAGRALARAQRKALRGAASGLREAIDRQRTVIRERMQEVARLVTELGVDEAHLPEIARALQAALIDPAVGEQLEEGHLERVPEASGGLFSLAPEDDAPAAEPAPKAKAKAKTRDAAQDEAAAKKEAAAQRAAARKAAAAEKAAAKKKEADERRAAIAEAEARAEALAKAASTAEAEATKARKIAAAARKDAAAAAAALARLRRAR